MSIRSQKIILADILTERARQDELVKSGKHPFSCATPTWVKTGKAASNAEKTRIVGEEYGEVCRASYERDHVRRPHDSTEGLFDSLREQDAHLREELIQLAAVCVAWVESLDAKQP